MIPPNSIVRQLKLVTSGGFLLAGHHWTGHSTTVLKNSKTDQHPEQLACSGNISSIEGYKYI
jgi:hypothetical protein